MRVTTDKQPHSNKSYQNLICWTNRIEMFSAEMILTRKATSCMHIVPCLPIHICACHCTRGGTTYEIWCHFFLRLHLSLWKTDSITCWHPSGLWKYELFRLPCHGPTVTYFRSILTITRPIWQTSNEATKSTNQWAEPSKNLMFPFSYYATEASIRISRF